MKELTVRNAQIAAYIGSLSKTSAAKEVGAVLLTTGGLTGVGGANASGTCADNLGNCVNVAGCQNTVNGGQCTNYSGDCIGTSNGMNCLNTSETYKPGFRNLAWTCPK